ncbi:MAG: hypothetical protein FWE50_00510 [Alphaproteobacteria bacterium]|nr:hypothetical protein [Alphaproteobacteria bacterium]
MQHDIHTDTFTLRIYQKLTNSTAVIKIYIEGDGNAFDGWGHPTSDPTPRDDFMQRLAFEDPSPNVVYIARPCQYIKDPICTETDWTTARFSKKAVDASAEVIKQIVDRRPMILIGFSGGAQIAGLVAVLHLEINVKKLITIAGNLNHPEWTRMKNLPPLNQSLDLNLYKEEYNKFPQIHYVGTEDSVIPIILTAEFINNPERIIIIPNAKHGKGFESINHLIWEEN